MSLGMTISKNGDKMFIKFERYSAESFSRTHFLRRETLVFSAVFLVSACGGGGDGNTTTSPPGPPKLEQVTIKAISKPIITLDGYQFKDSNGNGQLDIYEDWRKPVSERIANLVSLMSLEEKAGLMLINTMNADAAGAIPASGVSMVVNQKMSRFIFRSAVTAHPTSSHVTPEQAAVFTNAVQKRRDTHRQIGRAPWRE